MRLDVAGDNFIERVGLLSGLVPRPVVSATLGIGYSKVIVTGTRLGLFEALAQGPLSVEALAKSLQCHVAGITALANALTGFGVLNRKNGLYMNRRVVKKWLLRSSKFSMVDVVAFLGYCHELLDNLDEQVRSGNIVRLHDKAHPPEFWRSYMGALAAFAKVMSPEVLSRAKVFKGAKRIVDVGGGHGLFGGLIAKKLGACSEVLDLPAACDAGRVIIEREGLSDLVTFRPGDFRRDALGQEVDVVLIFNVLHNASEAEARKLLVDAFSALRPGGQIILCDGAHRGTDRPLDASAGYNELFFYVVSGAQVWPESELCKWLSEAGFMGLSTSRLFTAPSVMIRAQKPHSC